MNDILLLHVATIVYAAVLPVVEVWFLILDPVARAHAWLAILATAVTVPLHLRLVWLALRGEPPPRAAVTVAVIAAVTLGAGVVIGAAWVKMFAVVGASGLIVLRRNAATMTFIGSLVAGWVLAASVEPFQYAPPGLAYVTYLALSVAWRSVALFALVWLVTSYHHLVTARAELRTEAVVRERQRVHAELATTVDARLSSLVALGRGYDTVETDHVDDVLARINGEAAEALGRTRDLVAGYRATTRAVELRAAIGLLEAAGIRAEALADGIDLDAPADPTFSAQLQAAVRQALDHAADSRVALRVRSADGATTVELWMPEAGSATDAT